MDVLNGIPLNMKPALIRLVPKTAAFIVVSVCLNLPNVAAEVAYAGFSFESNYAQIGDGSRIHYIEEGEGDPIVLVHGAPTHAYLWRNVIPHLSDTHRVIALDLPNFGRSDKVGTIGMPEYTARFGEFVDTLGLDKFGLVMHDIGGPIAMNWANANRERVSAVSLLETFVGPIPNINAAPPFFLNPLNLFDPVQARQAAVINNGFVEGLLLNPAAGLINRVLTAEEAEIYRAPFDTQAKREPLGNLVGEFAVADGTGHPVLDPDGVGGLPPTVHPNLDYFLAVSEFLLESDANKHFVATNPGGTFPISQLPFIEEQFTDFIINVIGDPSGDSSGNLGTTPGRHFLQEDLPNEYGIALSNFFEPTPVPLPGGLVLMLSALGGLFVSKRSSTRDQ
jgi:haloalkane dehalogenase